MVILDTLLKSNFFMACLAEKFTMQNNERFIIIFFYPVKWCNGLRIVSRRWSFQPLQIVWRIFFVTLFRERSDKRGAFSLSSRDTVELEELPSASHSVSLSRSRSVSLSCLNCFSSSLSSLAMFTRARSNYARNIAVNFILPIIPK